MRKEQPPEALVGFPDDVRGFLDRHLPHDRQRKGFKVFGEMFAFPLPRRGNPAGVAAFPAATPGERAYDLGSFSENVHVPPTARLGVIIATDLPALAGRHRTNLL